MSMRAAEYIITQIELYHSYNFPFPFNYKHAARQQALSVHKRRPSGASSRFLCILGIIRGI